MIKLKKFYLTKMRIELGDLNYKLLILLLYPIFFLLKNLILNSTSHFYGFFTCSLSYLLSGPFYLLILYRSKIHNKLFIKEDSEYRNAAVHQVFAEDQNTIKQRKIKKIISMFLLSILKMASMIVQALLNQQLYETFNESLGILSGFIFYAIYSKLFLNSKIYKHQYISLFIISFCSLIFLIIKIKKNDKSIDILDIVKSLLCLIVIYGYYTLYDVLVKKHFEIYSTNPYKLMFIVGLFSFILIIPLDIFAYFYDKKGEIFGLNVINQIYTIYKKNESIFIFISKILLDIISGFFCYGGIIFTFYYFTPCHFITSLTLLQILSEVFSRKNNDKNEEWYMILLFILLNCIINVSSLIYNEIIIVHFWSMEKNTFKYISMRQKIEFDELSENKLVDYYEDKPSKRSETLSFSSVNEC